MSLARRSPLDRLALAASDENVRPTEGRLAGWNYIRRADGGRRGSHLVKLSASIRADHDAKSASDHAAGVAALIVGELDAAIHELRSAVAQTPSDPGAWNDLSVAYLERGLRRGDIRDLLRSVGAADRALAGGAMPEALFNRAVALQTIGVDGPAIATIDRYLGVDAKSPWSAEMQNRRRAINLRQQDKFAAHVATLRKAASRNGALVNAIVRRFPQQARLWSETVFLSEWAKAHLLGGGAAELDLVETIGRTLRATNGDAEIEDTVSVIRRELNRGRVGKSVEIARAHLDYDRARRLYADREADAALPLFSSAARTLDAVGSPMAIVARYYAANARFDQHDVDGVEATLRDLKARTSDRYPALQAQVTWQLGTVMGSRGELYESLDLYQDAAAALNRLGEAENETAVRSSLTHILAKIGRTDEAWENRSRLFTNIHTIERADTLHSILATAGHDASRERDWPLADAIFTVGLDAQRPGAALNLRRRVNYFVTRAAARWHLGQRSESVADSRRARICAAAIRSQGLRQEAVVEITRGEAKLIRSADPARAITLLAEAIGFLEQNQKTIDIVELFLERARAYRALARIELWTSDVLAALRIVEERRGRADSVTASDEYALAERDAYLEATDALELQQADLAFEVADRGRTHLIESHRPTSATESSVRAALRQGTMLVHYTVVGDQAIVFWMTASSFEHRRVAFNRSRPETLLEPFATALTTHQRVIIVPDAQLSDVPFAALRNPSTGRRLVHDVAIAIAPSAAFFLHSQNAARPFLPHALIVGDPAFNQELFPGRPRLAAAAAEAGYIASLYKSRTVLTGHDANVQRFLAEAASSDLVHIASHAETESANPAVAVLLLAPTASHSGALSVRRLHSDLPVRNRLVFLVACRTGAYGHAGNFAYAFLSRGSTSVIGTIRDVPDDASRDFSGRVHRLIQAGHSPAEAVRQTQIAMDRSASKALSDPGVWGAFQVYGSGD